MNEPFSTPNLADSITDTVAGNSKPIQADSPAIGKDDIDTAVPATLYEQKHGRPLIADILHIKTESLEDRQRLKVIDEYLKDQIETEEYEDTQESYKELFEELLRITGVNKLDINRLDKLHQIITLRRFFK